MTRLFTIMAAFALSMSFAACSNGTASGSREVSGAAIEQLDSAAHRSEEAVEDLTTSENADVVEEYSSSTTIPSTLTEPIVFDFNAVWCPPCQRFKPVFHNVARSYSAKARFISVDVDKNEELARQFRVSSIPQISILKTDGKVVSVMGYMDKAEFTRFLDANL